MTQARARWLVLAALSAGVVFQSPVASCGQFGLNLVASTFDACSILNCTSGTFFNFCSPTVVLLDCPGTAEGDGGETP